MVGVGWGRYHLVAHDLAPVGAVLVGLHDGHVVVVVVDDERLLPGGLVDALGAVLEDVALLRLKARVDDGHLVRVGLREFGLALGVKEFGLGQTVLGLGQEGQGRNWRVGVRPRPRPRLSLRNRGGSWVGARVPGSGLGYATLRPISSSRETTMPSGARVVGSYLIRVRVREG